MLKHAADGYYENRHVTAYGIEKLSRVKYFINKSLLYLPADFAGFFLFVAISWVGVPTHKTRHLFIIRKSMVDNQTHDSFQHNNIHTKNLQFFVSGVTDPAFVCPVTLISIIIQ